LKLAKIVSLFRRDTDPEDFDSTADLLEDRSMVILVILIVPGPGPVNEPVTLFGTAGAVVRLDGLTVSSWM
jgi:hypothetical protein